MCLAPQQTKLPNAPQKVSRSYTITKPVPQQSNRVFIFTITLRAHANARSEGTMAKINSDRSRRDEATGAVVYAGACAAAGAGDAALAAAVPAAAGLPEPTEPAA